MITAATVHVVYGESVSDRLLEIGAQADYRRWPDEIAKGTPRLLMGDFNLAPDHAGWASLREFGVRPAITDGRSKLATTVGEYANLYDNLWYNPGRFEPSERGILRFPDLLALDHLTSRDRVSDHAPVCIGINGARLEPQQANGTNTSTGSVSSNCIYLNTAAPSRLEDMSHVGPARAETVVSGCPWSAPGDLTQVNVIGTVRLEEIRASGILSGAKLKRLQCK